MYYSKRRAVRWLAHLDLARAVDRAVRRAGLPVAYSQGFHPHAQISFGPPLPVGAEGLQEPCCLDLAGPATPERLARDLARQMPEGMELVALEVTSRGRRSPLADLTRAQWELRVAPELDLARLRQAAEELRAAPRWEVSRQTKRRVHEVDLRGGLYLLQVQEQPQPALLMELSVAPDSLVKPQEVAQAVAQLASWPGLPVRRWIRAWLR